MFRNKVSGTGWEESKVQILLGESREVKKGWGGGWGNGKGLCAQQTKLHGLLLIIKMAGCTSGVEHDFKWYIDTLLDKTDSHNEKFIPFSNLFYSLDTIKKEVSVWYKYVFMASGYSPEVKIRQQCFDLTIFLFIHILLSASNFGFHLRS